MNDADHIIKWDPIAQSYESAYKVDGTGGPFDGVWVEDQFPFMTSGLSFHPGEAFWIDNRQGVTQAVYLAGAVVLERNKPGRVAPGLEYLLVSVQFPDRVERHDPGEGRGLWRNEQHGIEFDHRTGADESVLAAGRYQ